MIISHKLRLLFLKTKKVGGTSFEMALSKFCGDADVITPLTPSDEKTRELLGFKGAQNFSNTVWVKHVDGKAIPFGQTKGVFFNHIPASVLRGVVPGDIWDNYLIVSMVRSPYEVTISRYYWEGARDGTGLGFEEFVLKFPEFLDENQSITHIDGESVVQHYIRYEHLEEDIRALEAKIGVSGIWDVFKTINAKGGFRPPEGTDAKSLFADAPRARKLIERRCAYDIRRFNYTIEG